MQSGKILENENELISKAQKGDVKALEQILNFYTPTIKGIVRHYFLIGADDDDLLQIGFISLSKAIQEYDKSKNASFKTYLHMCVHGDIKNEITKSQNGKNRMLGECSSLDVEADDEDSWAVVLVSEDDSPEETAIKKQKVGKIIQFLKQNLSDYERIVVSKYLSCYSYNEIAKITNSTTKMVDNTISKVKRILKKFKKEADL